LQTKDPTESKYSAQVQVQEAAIVGENCWRPAGLEGRNSTARVTSKNMSEIRSEHIQVTRRLQCTVWRGFRWAVPYRCLASVSDEYCLRPQRPRVHAYKANVPKLSNLPKYHTETRSSQREIRCCEPAGRKVGCSFSLIARLNGSGVRESQEVGKVSDDCSSIPLCGSPPHALTAVTHRTVDWDLVHCMGEGPLAARTDTGVEDGPVEPSRAQSSRMPAQATAICECCRATWVRCRPGPCGMVALREARPSSRFWRW
jgi:hypothetical protein